MRKILSLLLVVMLLLSMLALTGCSDSKAQVESVLEIDSYFSGHRQITIKYPLDTSIDSLSEILIEKNPLKDSKTSKFEYRGVEQDGYIFVMDIAFESHGDYISQVSDLVGRQVTSDMSQPQSVLCSGTRMKEDFDVADLIRWIVTLSSDNEETKSVEYDYFANTISINGTVFNTSSTVDISQREGKPINSILVETTNLKDGTFDRSVTFVVPNKTYTDLAGSIEPYFASITHPQAQYSGWTNQGTNWEYKVIFKALSIDELSEFTAKLFDIKTDDVFYGDKDNSSTPLSEGLVFEENFNTFSFMNSSGESVALEYRYALPTKTTHGDGSVYSDGRWNTAGMWQDGVYSTSFDSDTMKLRIPDGIQYAINGIDMNLEVVDKDYFIRTTEFMYSKTQGMDGMLYAYEFFKNKGVRVETDETEDNLVCRVICEGSTAQITDELVKLFGSGNFLAYKVKEKSMSLCAKTQFTDYVNLANILNSTNANRPINYSVKSSSDENVIELSYDGKDSAKKSKNSTLLTVSVDGGQGTITYNGNIPNKGNIILYSTIGILMLLCTIGAIIFMLYKQHKKKVDTDESEPSFAPQQTTTFSIAELGALSNEANKEVIEQIDKEIEEKIEADRIQEKSRELKAQEIAHYEKMIYGTDEESDENQEDSNDTPDDNQPEE